MKKVSLELLEINKDNYKANEDCWIVHLTLHLNFGSFLAQDFALTFAFNSILTFF